jgi:hypothetical protein
MQKLSFSTNAQFDTMLAFFQPTTRLIDKFEDVRSGSKSETKFSTGEPRHGNQVHRTNDFGSP